MPSVLRLPRFLWRKSVLEESLFTAEDSTRLPITLRDISGSAAVAQAVFLEAINERANQTQRWILRPRGYPNKTLYWTVGGIASTAGSSTQRGSIGSAGLVAL